MSSFTDLTPLGPGAQGVIYDIALRGVHHQKLLRDLGLLPVNKVTAAKGAPRRGAGQRVPRSTFVEQRTVMSADGITTDLQVFARDGASPSTAPSTTRCGSAERTLLGTLASTSTC